jgi:N-acetylglucosamine-6-phosphate deacetylase
MSAFAVRGMVLLGESFAPGVVLIEDGRIAAVLDGFENRDVSATIYDAPIIAPGFIDLQVNGGFGVEVGKDPDAIRTLAARLPETGVTAFLPTIVTSLSAVYAEAYRAFHVERDANSARPLGFHIEGPFLAPTKHGAHRRVLIERADPGLLDMLLEGDAMRLITLAPERPDAPELMRKLHARGVLISLGHTDATYEQFVAGVDAGARMATHLYNAMSPFGHRAPGAIGAALLDDRVTVGLIADGIHAHPASLQLAFRVKDVSHIALVSDMMTAAGMPPGAYALSGQSVIVDGTAARLVDGTLAGSLLTMDQAVRNMVRWTDATVADALRMASAVPARLLGLDDRGEIRIGAVADLVLLDNDLTVQATIIGGAVVHERGGA